MRNILLASCVAAVLVIGAGGPALAQTTDNVQAQVQELLAKIAELQERIAELRGFSTTPSGVTAPAFKHRICSILYRNIVLGTEGSDVSGLQEFLRDQGFFLISPTGFFGPITSEALRRWQAANDVDTAGVLGPRTRARIGVWCRGEVNDARFGAEPRAGQAPLNVTFKAMVGGFTPYKYGIEFGDGTVAANIRCIENPNIPDVCGSPAVVEHTYKTDGTYTAVLWQYGADADIADSGRTALGRILIRVGDAVSCTTQYQPVCGAKPVTCVTTPCDPIPTTYSNRCLMNADGASFLYDGVCQSDGNKPPTVSSFSGPTTLGVNETGTWTIAASDPENGTLSYHIEWGDDAINPLAALLHLAENVEFVQTTTFEHAYSRSGFYIITMAVRDEAGNTTKTTSTVRVESDSNTFCTADAYLCPNGTYVGRTGPNCQFVCPGGTITDGTHSEFTDYQGARCTHNGRTYYENDIRETVNDWNYSSTCEPHVVGGECWYPTLVCRAGTWLQKVTKLNDCTFNGQTYAHGAYHPQGITVLGYPYPREAQCIDGTWSTTAAVSGQSCVYKSVTYKSGQVAPCNGVISGDRCNQATGTWVYNNVCRDGSWQQERTLTSYPASYYGD